MAKRWRSKAANPLQLLCSAVGPLPFYCQENLMVFFDHLWQNVSPSAERCCAGCGMGSRALGARTRLPGFLVSFSLHGMWDNAVHGSVAAGRGCGFMNYFFPNENLPFPFLPPRMLKTNRPQHSLMFPVQNSSLKIQLCSLEGGLE